MLAFWALEKDEHGSYTEDCELGADLEFQFQSAVVNIDANITAYFEARAKAARKPPHG